MIISRHLKGEAVCGVRWPISAVFFIRHRRFRISTRVIAGVQHPIEGLLTDLIPVHECCI